MIKTQMAGLRGQKKSDRVVEGRWRYKGIDFTVEEYNALLQAQNFRCGICNKHQDEFKMGLFVDHDHSTGIVRGLLCVRCNSVLGLSLDSISILEKAIKYLSPHVYLDFDDGYVNDEEETYLCV